MKQSNIKISTLIPVYNTSKFLEKCVRSIMIQNFKDIEIICVNDGSTDNSLEILEKLQKEDSRIIIINKKNEGVSKARNTALKIVKGKYCLNIDSDDWIEQGYLKALYKRAEKDDLDITISDFLVDYGSNKNYIFKDLKITNDKILSGKEYINVFLRDNFQGATWNKLIKTELYKKNKIIYNQNIFMMEDVEAILKLAFFAKKVGKLNKYYYHYIQHENNGSLKISIKRLEDINNCFLSLIDFFYKKKEKEIYLEIKKTKLIILFIYMAKSYKLRKEEYFIELQKKYLIDLKNICFFNVKNEKAKKLKLTLNFLKIFPNVHIINLLFKIYILKGKLERYI